MTEPGMMNHFLYSTEINYLAESLSGEEISVRTSEEKESKNTFIHSVTRINDNRELCRIKMVWNEGNNKNE